VAVDHDAATLAHSPAHSRVRLVRSDVRRVREPADLIAVLNYSICELHDRRALVAYLRHARRRLRPGGCFVCDVYDGADAFITGSVSQPFRAPGGHKVVYTWEQRTADPLTGRIVNAMHFEVRPPGRAGRSRTSVRLNDAFIYDWRLWSVRELREAMTDAGFARTEVYARQPGAIDGQGEYHTRPVEDALELGDSFSVYIVARAARP
jgi:hypothetical protein